MRRLFCIIIVMQILITLPCSFSLSEEIEPVITRVSIGMSKEEVRSIERFNAYSEDDSSLHYIDTVYDIPADVFYTFEDNVLQMIFVRFVEAPVVANGYITSFNKVDASLVNDFGKPSIDNDHIFSDTLTLSKTSDNYGLLVFIGELTIKSIWNNAETQMGHVLLGDGEIVTHGILIHAV